MTASDYEPTKEPFSANDNYQETNRPFGAGASCEKLQFPAGFSSLPCADHNPAGSRRSSMVSGAGAAHPVAGDVHLLAPPFVNWFRKTKIGRRPVTRQLTLSEVRDLKSAWHHAKSIGQPVNRFVTFRPHDINDQNPQQRIETWLRWRNKLAQFARDHGFDFTCLWTRESKRDTGQDEHMHVLLHVPKSLRRRFDLLVKSWCGGTDEIDVRGCSYQTRRNKKGGEESVVTYIAKNSPQARRYLNHTIQLGGPIFGKRYGLSRNLTSRARARHEVAGVLRRDLGLVTVQHGSSSALPEPANDRNGVSSRTRIA